MIFFIRYFSKQKMEIHTVFNLFALAKLHVAIFISSRTVVSYLASALHFASFPLYQLQRGIGVGICLSDLPVRSRHSAQLRNNLL